MEKILKNQLRKSVFTSIRAIVQILYSENIGFAFLFQNETDRPAYAGARPEKLSVFSVSAMLHEIYVSMFEIRVDRFGGVAFDPLAHDIHFPSFIGRE